jgi:hypothetical protein
MTDRRSGWRRIYESYACTYCGAGPGQRCLSLVTKKPTMTIHMARVNAADRCAKCGTGMDADRVTEGANLCPRCALVRSLEVERATVHRRSE